MKGAKGYFFCLVYLAAIGLSSFFLGRVLPKKWFSYEKVPFRPFPAEKDGKVYEKIGIRKWKDAIPDMSKVFPSLMPSKKMPRDASPEQIERMVEETCVAEWIHGLLGILGFGCAAIRKDLGGWIVSFLYLMGNVPYVLVQRYNRPKLVRILRRMGARRERAKGAAV